MTRAALINALLYEFAKWLIKHKPALAFSPLIIRLLAWCRPDWEQWKVSETMESVDSQAAALVQQWEKDDKTKQAIELVQKAQQLFLKNNIILREMTAYGLSNCLRASIGKDDENQQVLKILQEISTFKN